MKFSPIQKHGIGQAMRNDAQHALQRTAAGCRGCNIRASWPPSLSLGRSAKQHADHTLAAKADAIPTVARWLYEEWGHRREGNSYERTRQRLLKAAANDSLPIYWVAVEGEAVAIRLSRLSNLMAFSTVCPFHQVTCRVPERKVE